MSKPTTPPAATTPPRRRDDDDLWRDLCRALHAYARHHWRRTPKRIKVQFVEDDQAADVGILSLEHLQERRT